MPDAKLPHVAERHRPATRLIGFVRCWISHWVTPNLPQVVPTRGALEKRWSRDRDQLLQLG